MFQELIGLQRDQTEVGRIRMGTSTPKTSRSGRAYNEPVKLERFRLTSRNRKLVDAAAELYGGSVEPWEPQGGGAPQWQVLIDAEELPIMLAATPVLQAYQTRDRANGKLLRSCDGVTNAVTGEGCLCEPEQRVCKTTTWLRVMLIDLPGIGYWRLESHGNTAGRELPAMAQFLRQVGDDVPAVLRMEERQSQVPDPRDPNKELTARYMVPVIHVEVTPRQLLTGQVQRLAVPAAATVPAQPAGPAQVQARPEVPALPAGSGGTALEVAAQASPPPDPVVLAGRAIGQAATRGQMNTIRQEAQAGGFWLQIQPIWTARAHEIVAAEQEQQRLAQVAAPEPAPTPEQMQTAWQGLVGKAGALGWPNNRLVEFAAQNTGGKATWDLTMADFRKLDELLTGVGK